MAAEAGPAPAVADPAPTDAAPAPTNPLFNQVKEQLDAVRANPGDFAAWATLISTAEKLVSMVFILAFLACAHFASRCPCSASAPIKVYSQLVGQETLGVPLAGATRANTAYTFLGNTLDLRYVFFTRYSSGILLACTRSVAVQSNLQCFTPPACTMLAGRYQQDPRGVR